MKLGRSKKKKIPHRQRGVDLENEGLREIRRKYTMIDVEARHKMPGRLFLPRSGGKRVPPSIHLGQERKIWEEQRKSPKAMSTRIKGEFRGTPAKWRQKVAIKCYSWD